MFINEEEKREFSHDELNRISNSLAPWKSMSFACGGWLQFYMFGVARAIQARGLERDVTYCGCSAGALTAVGLLLDGDFDRAVQFCKEYCLPKAYGEISGLLRLSDYVSKCIDLTVKSKYKSLPAGLLQVAVTVLPTMKGQIITNFDDFDDLKKALLGSSAAFPFAQLVNRKGQWLIDGGLSIFQPVIDDNTVTVSPFYFSDCDIKPSRYVPLWWAFFPPKSSSTVDWLYNLGWDDAMNYFDKCGIPVDSPNVRYNMQSIVKQPHPYDIPRRVSMHRLLGYKFESLANEYVSFTIDFVLLLLFLFFFKPLALLSIYVELYINILFCSLFMFAANLCKSIIKIIFGRLIQICRINCIKNLIDSDVIKTKPDVMSEKVFESITCVFSLSLFLRFISLRPSSSLLRKHKRLEKISLLYRIFRHII